MVSSPLNRASLVTIEAASPGFGIPSDQEPFDPVDWAGRCCFRGIRSAFDGRPSASSGEFGEIRMPSEADGRMKSAEKSKRKSQSSLAQH